jgi:hypothetical protein
MSEAPRSTASEITRWTSWMTDASSPEAPKLTVWGVRSKSGPAALAGAASESSSSSAVGLGRGAAAAAPGRIAQPLEHELDVARGGDGGAHLVAGHHRDVVDGEHVRRIRHRDEQRAVADERHRDRLVALDRGGRDELGGVGVDPVVLEVEVVEAEPLGDRARELALGDRARREQDPLGGRAGPVRPARSASSIASALDEARGRRSRRSGSGPSHRGATAWLTPFAFPGLPGAVIA